MDEFKKAFGDMDSSYTSVPYIVHEGEMARMERTIKRLWILSIVIFSALILTNGGWIWFESQFEEVTLTQEADGDEIVQNGVGIGDIYGPGEADS